MIYLKQVKLYCKEYWKIENYDEAINSDEVYECHHRLELTINGEYAHGIKDLKRLNMYYNRPYFELIFLKVGAHSKLHALSRSERTNKLNSNWHGEHRLTDKHKRNISISMKGHVVSDDQRIKTSNTRKGTKLKLCDDGKYHWVRI